MTFLTKKLFSCIEFFPWRLSFAGAFIGLFFFVWLANASSEFVATTVSDLSAGTSTNVAITDVGGGNGDVALVLGAETSDQAQTDHDKKRDFDNTHLLAQTFSAGQNGFLTKVIVSLDRNNSSNTNGDITLEIRTTQSGTPTSTVLTSTTMAASSVNKNGATDYTFVFGSPPTMASGTVYAIVVYRSGSGTITANYNWYSGDANTNQYANGGRYEMNMGAAHPSWNLQNSGKGDLRFQTFYRAYAGGTLGSSVLDSATSTSRFLTLSWGETVSAGEDITFQARASNSIFSATDISPSWISLGSADWPIDLSGFFTSAYRYFQWQANFSGTGTTTPTLHDVSAAYNRPPVAQSQSVETDEDTPITITLTGTDLDNDALSFATSTSPTHGALGLISGNQLTYTPAQNYFGVDSFDFAASDGIAESSPVSILITIHPVNDVPLVNSVMITPSAPKTNDLLTANVNASDAEGDTLTYTYQWKKNNGDISGATSQTFDLSASGAGDKGDVISVEMVALDLSGGVSAPVVSSGVTIENTAPTAANASIILNEDATATTTLSALDPDSGDVLSYEIVTNPDPLLGSVGTVSGNEVLYTPAADAHGADSFTYRASDGTDWGNDATVNVTINSVDDPVLLDPIGNKTVDELATLAFTAHATDADASLGTIVYSLVNAPSGATIDSATGEFSWTPTEAQGPDDDTFKVHADSGSKSDEESITVTVNEVNEMPAVSNATTSTLMNASTTVSVVGQDNDAPANILSFFVVDGPSHGTVGNFSGTDTIYAPDVNYSGFDTFTFRAFDGTAYSAFATATIAVIVSPSATPAAGIFTQAQSVTLAALGATQIRFTTDDTDPSCAVGTVYASPISITETDTIRAIACFGTIPSSVSSFIYTIHWNISSDHIDDLWTSNVFMPANGTSTATTAVNVGQNVKINIQMGAGTSTVEIPAGTVITQTGGSAFSAADMNAHIAAPGIVVVDAGNTLIAALEWGIPGITLEFSSPITIHIFVGVALNGETIHVGRSVSGTGGWTQDGIVSPATCVVAQGICAFSVTKASFYAATTPAPVPPAASGASSSSGSAPSGASSDSGGIMFTSSNGGSSVNTPAISPPITIVAQTDLPPPQTPNVAEEKISVSKTNAVTPNPINNNPPSEVNNQETKSQIKPNEGQPKNETSVTPQTNEQEQSPQNTGKPEQRSLLAAVGNALTLGTGRTLVAIGVLAAVMASVFALAWRFLL